MNDVLHILSSAVLEGITYFLSPNKRIFWVYLIAAILLMTIWAIHNKKSVYRALKHSFSLKYWWNSSGKLDIQWFFLNKIFAVIFILPILTGQVALALDVYRSLDSVFGSGDFLQWSSTEVMFLFTVCVFIAEDFSRFIVHYAYHKIPLLWRFHAIHHSAKTMTPLTLYRVHFVEYFINSCRSLVVIGTVSGAFMYCFEGTISIYEILGVSIFSLLFNLAGSNLRHSHIWLGFGWFENIFISPAQHQLHHSSSEKHLDKNFGASLAIWDKIFGCWMTSKAQKVKRFGLYKTSNKQKLAKQILGIRN